MREFLMFMSGMIIMSVFLHKTQPKYMVDEMNDDEVAKKIKHIYDMAFSIITPKIYRGSKTTHEALARMIMEEAEAVLKHIRD